MALSNFDVVVIGGGPIGLATAYECAKAKKRVLVLEKSVFFNQSGSSCDMVRMFRTAYTENFMAKLAVQSMPLWDSLEKDAQTPLRAMTGLLNFGDPTYQNGPEGTLYGPVKNLEEHGLKYAKLSREEIMARHPFRDLPSDWAGLDMPDNGCINVPLLLRSLYKLCEAHGVRLLQYAQVTELKPDPHVEDGWRVKGLLGTSMSGSVAPEKFDFGTKKIAITAGAYVNHILYPSFGFTFNLDIWEMTSAYYSIDPKVTFPRMWFQFAKDTPDPTSPSQDGISNLFYGFPSIPWGPPNLSRIAVDSANRKRRIKDPNHRSQSAIDTSDLENTRSFVATHIAGTGLNPTPVFASNCLQTNVFDNMFVLDVIPEELLPCAGPARAKSIAVFTAGWAMKFVPLVGLVLKQLLVDGNANEYDISHFKMTRTGSKPGEHIVQQGDVKTEPFTSRVSGSSMRC